MIIKSTYFKQLKLRHLCSALLFAVLLFTMPSFFSWSVDRHIEPLSLAIVQGNHSQVDKLNKEKRADIRRDYLRFSQELLEDAAVDLLLWPETFTPGFNLLNQSFRRELNDLDTSILFGSARYSKGSFYNSAVLFMPGQAPVFYDKQRLMPFGEYWPYKTFFNYLGLSNIIMGNEYTAGSNLSLLNFHRYKIGVGICLESLYSRHFSHLADLGADCFAVLANGAWFKESTIIERHFLMGLFRAVENGRFFFHSTNTGISAIVSPQGRIIKQSHLNEVAVLQDRLPIYTLNTPYRYFKDSIAYFCFAFFLLICLKALVHKVQKR